MPCSCRLFLLCLLCFAFVPLGPPLAIWASNHFECRTRAWVDLVLVILGVGLGTALSGVANWSISLRSGGSFGLIYFIAFAIALWSVWTENNGPGCSGSRTSSNSEGKFPAGRRPRRRAMVYSSESGPEKTEQTWRGIRRNSHEEEVAQRRGLAAERTRRAVEDSASA